MWNESAAEWAKALRAYDKALALKKRLPSLDHFMWHELPAKVKQRQPAQLTGEEYSRIVSWKLTRGTYRVNLQKYADNLPEDEVERASKEAFALLAKREVRKALKKLVELKGCGPATASAILCMMDDSVAFMSDQLLMAALGDSKKYTAAVFDKLQSAVTEKAEELRREDSEHKWSARDIEQAAYAHMKKVVDGATADDDQGTIEQEDGVADYGFGPPVAKAEDEGGGGGGHDKDDNGDERKAGHVGATKKKTVTRGKDKKTVVKRKKLTDEDVPDADEDDDFERPVKKGRRSGRKADSEKGVEAKAGGKRAKRDGGSAKAASSKTGRTLRSNVAKVE